MHARSRHRTAAAALAALSLSLLLMVATALPAAAAARLPGHFGGFAFTASASAATGELAARLGRSAYQPCPCLGTNGKVLANTIADVRAGDLARLDVTKGKAYAVKSTNRTARTWTKSRVVGLDLLDGLITADLVLSVADVRADPARIRTSSAGSRFAGLIVAGKSIAATVKPNTKVGLPGLGHVVLRKIDRFGGPSRRGLIVTMILVKVTQGDNAYGLPVGAEIRIARSKSLYDRQPVRVDMRGAAYSTAADSTTTAATNRLGRAAIIYVGCNGTNGKLRANTVTDIRFGDTAGFTLGRNTVRGTVKGATGVLKSTARLEGAWLFDGISTTAASSEVVRVDLLRAVAKATYDARTGTGAVSSKGSTIANISIAGVVDVPIVVPPNTTFDIPGIGKVTLYKRDTKVTAGGAYIKVTMVQIVLEHALGALGLPVGTRIQLATARAWVGR